MLTDSPNVWARDEWSAALLSTAISLPATFFVFLFTGLAVWLSRS